MLVCLLCIGGGGGVILVGGVGVMMGCGVGMLGILVYNLVLVLVGVLFCYCML